MLFNESSLVDLYASTLRGFPNCSKRENATQTIRITNLRWTPFIGMKTLFIQGLAQNEGREYSPVILFKGVKYLKSGGIPFIDNDARTYFVEPLSLEDNDCLIRCQCQDFFWRGQHFNKLDHSLYGKDRKKYEAKYRPGSANPDSVPMICKHLMKMMSVLSQSGIVE